MRIAVNARFRGRHVSGVDRYASEVAKRLGDRVRMISPPRSLAGLRGHMWEQFVLPRYLGPAEVLWSPANSGPLTVARQVVTIHDLSALHHPEWFSPAFRLWYGRLIPPLARRARHILTVSEFSRQSIITSLHVPSERVTAVPNGVDMSVFRPTESQSVRSQYSLPCKYALFVGSIDPRKNLGRLIAAWKSLAGFPEVALVIVGARSEVFQRVDLDLSARGVRYLGYVPEQDLPGLYSGALFLIMPSLLEGFGLPVIEAMACGTPVIAATSGALPEVTGGAALQIDPYSIGSIKEAMGVMLDDPSLRARLSSLGLARAREFSWELSGDRIWQVLSAQD